MFSKNKLLHILRLMLGIFFLSWFIWLRLLREILPREWTSLMNLPLWYTGTLVLVLVLGLAKSLNDHLGFWPPPDTSRAGLRKVLEIFLWVYDSPATLFPQFWSALDEEKKFKYERIALKIMLFIRRRGEPPRIQILFTILVHVVPRMVLSLVFLIEILLAGSLDLFYRLLIILIIPALSLMIFHVLDKIAQARIEQSQIHLHWETVAPGLFRAWARDEELSQELFDKYYEYWSICWYYRTYRSYLEKRRIHYSSIYRVFSSYHYSLGWGYLIWEQILWILR